MYDFQVQLGERQTEYLNIKIDYGPAVPKPKKKKKFKEPEPIDETQVFLYLYFNTCTN